MNARIRLAIFGLAVAAALGWAEMSLADDQQWNGEPAVIDEIVIRVDKPRQKDDGFDWKGLIRKVIVVERGDMLTRSKLETAVSTLEAYGHVRTKVRTTAQGLRVDFLFLPYLRIKTIGIHNVYPLFEREIRNLMTIAPGDIYNPELIQSQAHLIAERYRAEGYIDPKVDITWQHDDSDGHVDIAIRIHKGSAYRLGQVRVTGNRALSDAQVKGRMSTWRVSAVQLGNGRLVEPRLKEDVDKLLAYLRGQGFADARIKYTVERDPEQQTVNVHIDIHQGPHYVIEFDGARHFSPNALKKELKVLEKGNRGNMGLRRTAQNIRRRYVKAGFPDAIVRWREVPSTKDPSMERFIEFNIQEGPRYIVHRVIISGNTALHTDVIRDQLLTRPPKGLHKGAYVADVLEEDVAAVGALYHQKGYLGARIADSVAVEPKTHQVTVTLSIDEGRQTHVGIIRIEGETPIKVQQLLAGLPMAPGNIFQPRMVSQGENELSARIAAEGFPHVQVSGRTVDRDGAKRIDIVYTIDPGPRVEVGRIYWVGNFRTRDRIIRREIKLVEGAPFSLTKVLEAQRRLRELGLFQSVQMRSLGLTSKASKVHLLVTLVEKSSYYFELGAGFQTDKEFYGRIKVGDRNFLGHNNEIRLSGEVSAIGYRWDADLVEPRFLRLPVSATLGLFTERREELNQDFGTDTNGGNLTFSRLWDDRLTTALGVRYERREQFLRERDAGTLDIDPETLEPRALWVITPAIRYDSRDSFIRPTQGYFAGLAVDISKGLDNSLDDFIKTKLDLRAYRTPRQRLTLAARTLVGYIHSYGDNDEIPKDQLFFLGGTTDVRGFGENMLRFNGEKDPVGGRLALAANVEGRYTMARKWELTVFLDTGAIQKAPPGDDNGDDQWQWTAGLGLRYITPIGPVGLLYGHKLDPRPGEGSGQFHFSIGYTY
jgi:outer membrane protein insertion porin family